ncbi:37559_t:CDS:2 [Gigaspora margarita]|uniref:37559_t:CDS:1 n=1 Tax=Gigaspora margarita TaxID=4874 RepID=A0ABN7URN9_GIGMA|nr:37559_t:CDS:2 [Gigaspora margarita]
MTTNFQQVFLDLTSPQDRGVEINISTFDPTGDLHTQIITAYITMQQLQWQGKREEALGHTFFIGQLIDTMMTTLAQRTGMQNSKKKFDF